MPRHLVPGILAASLLSGPAPILGAAPAPPTSLAPGLLEDLRSTLGLESAHALRLRSATPDPVLGGEVVRVDQYYQGVRVMQGEAILHLRGGRVQGLTDDLKRRFSVDTRPDLTASEALAIAAADLAPRGPFAYPPTTELVVARLKLGPGAPRLREALLYRIHLVLQNELDGTRATDYLVDAHSGAVAKRWDSLRTAAEMGVGHSQYSGRVAINVSRAGKGFELRDRTRGDKGGNTVRNLDHDYDGDGRIYTSFTNTWGDGTNYGGGSTRAANGQTAAVDAAYGLQWTWDYYRNIFQRQGIDGKGSATVLRVHYGKGYDNAFWSDDCFCMTFGDGTKFKSLEAMDVMGHEMSHGVCAATANLDYFGESGGLNEANSDINGTMVEFYAHSGCPDRIGDRGGDWTIGELLATPAHPDPLRYLYRPSLDGKSPDAWEENLEDLNVHRSSGPMNRCFYFLSQGSARNSANNRYSPRLPGGMSGIGNDKAARIWYRALSTYLTSGSDYAAARQACIKAARDLYGKDGDEEQAVWNAFHGINVGDAWSGGDSGAALRS
jgi:Zn-dependent metalloprotease